MSAVDDELLSDVLLRLEELAETSGQERFESLVALDTQLQLQLASDPALAESAHRRFAALRAFDRCLQPADHTPGTAPNIPGYELVEEIGRGGMGRVYRARQTAIGRTVAIKVLLAGRLAGERLRQRFAQEATAIGRLQHSHIVQVFDSGEVDGVAYLALEFVCGGNLAERLGGQPQPQRHAAELLRKLAEAVQFAHERGIVHRDLKPSNILLTESGTPKIADFGLARLLEDDTDCTRSGEAPGTPSYMAPEQVQGNVSPAVDTYALGAILYELLTGRPPFLAGNVMATLEQVRTVEPMSPRTFVPGISRSLEAICLKCLEKSPSRRYTTAAELATELRRFLNGEPTVARPLTRAQRLLNWTRRRPALASLIAVATFGAFALAALGSAFVVQSGRARETAEALRTDAEASAERAGQYMYASQMRQAYEWLDQGQINRVEKLLDEYEPSTRLAHLRGFEWYHLKRQLHGERLSLDTRHGEVYAVAFSPDGKVLASGGQNGLISFWDSASGKELASVAGHRSCVNIVAYSPDGKILASASCDHKIKLWQATTHELLTTLSEHMDEVHCLAFSPDGDRLASGGHDGVARVWNVATRNVVNSLDVKGWIDSLSWLNDGHAVVMGSERGHATLWNVETNKFREAGREIHGVAVSPVNSDVLLPQRDGYFENWKPDFSAKIDGYLGKIFGFPRAIAFSPDGTFLASGGDQIVLRLWFRGDDPHARPLSGHTERIQAIAFHPRGDMIASGSFDGTVKLWGGLNSESIPRLSTPYFDNQLSADQMRLYGVTISADFRYIAVRTSATEVSVFDLATAAQVETIPVSTHATTGLNFLGAAPPVLFGIWQDETRIMKWDIAADKSVGSIPVAAAEKLFSDDPSVYFLLSADDRHLIQADHSNVTITDVSSGDTWFNLACKPSVNRDSPRIHVSPNGTIVDVSLGDHGSSTVDLETRQSWRREWPGALAVANHAKLIAYPVSTAILVMQPDSGREMCVLEHRAAALSADFSPDSRTLATATHDGHVFLWNVATGELITHFDPRAVITKLQFSADGRKLAGVSLDGAHRGPDGSEGVVRVFVWEGNDGP